ncbi:MAG: glycogen synthase [Planctomycetes bacterium]|nr:glycogen synthase [Planctomycetota bacterium]
MRATSLAEVSESLARTLRQEGADIRVFLPWTADLNTSSLAELEHVGEVRVRDGQGKQPVQVHTGLLGDLPVVLLDHPQLLRNRYPYAAEEGPYPDNWRRYALYSRAVLESFPMLGFEPEILHCMDWTTGLIPVLREIEYAAKQPDHPAAKAGTFFAVHNFALQGSFEREILPHIGIPHRLFQHVHGVELAGKVNYLKAGCEFATIIGVNSPSQSERLQGTDRGYGLEDTFRRRHKELVGITNGVDYRAWDPSNDPLLPQTFSSKDRELNGKRKCKASLQAAMGLDNGARILLAAVIGRFDADSGFDLLAEVMTQILERNVEVVLMGSGKHDILERVRTMETTFAGRCRLIEGYNASAAHTLLGGADLLIQPSHFHSSNSLVAIGMRYGVAPLIYAQSGLEDTVIDYEKDKRKGTGFTFTRYTGEGLLEGVDLARRAYNEAAEWRTIAHHCLKQDFSWQASAREYLKAYRRVTRRTKSQVIDD